MRLLLDTHVLLWTMFDSPRLSSGARALVEGGEHVYVASAVSIWEIAIKYARGLARIDAMPVSGQEMLAHLETTNVEILSIAPDHAAAVDDLPPIHHDPFDRMLVAQAKRERITLLTQDKQLAAYGDFVLVV